MPRHSHYFAPGVVGHYERQSLLHSDWLDAISSAVFRALVMIALSGLAGLSLGYLVGSVWQ